MPILNQSRLLLSALGIDFAAQALGFVHAAAFRTEKLYDFFGSGTFLGLTAYTFFMGVKTTRASVASALAATWAARLGVFLFGRVLAVGHDKRFEEAKANLPKFAVFWFMQGVWVFATLLPVMLLNSYQGDDSALNALDYIGISVWAAGFLIETTADVQKMLFKKRNPNTTTWIEEGLWGYSRHPNYFGEITLWVGMYLLSWNGLSGGLRAVAAISPVFITLLLCFASGIPILEASADKRWGELAEYQAYKKRVSILVPLPRGWCKQD